MVTRGTAGVRRSSHVRISMRRTCEQKPRSQGEQKANVGRFWNRFARLTFGYEHRNLPTGLARTHEISKRDSFHFRSRRRVPYRYSTNEGEAFAERRDERLHKLTTPVLFGAQTVDERGERARECRM